MADILKWARDRKKQVQGAYHQANPWDDGRTYDTNQRGVNPGVQNPVDMRRDDTPGFQLTNNSLTRGLSRGYDQANIFDNGLSWKQRIANTDNSVIAQATPIGKALIKSPVQMLNTAATQIAEVPATVEGYVLTQEQSDVTKKMLEAQKRGDTAAYEAFKAKSSELSGRIQNVFRQQEAGHEMFNENEGGLFNMGTFYGAEDSRRGDLKTGVTKIGGGTLQTAATVAPFAKGGSVAVMLGGKSLPAKMAISGAEGLGYGATYSTGSQLQTTGKVDPRTLIKDTLIGGGVSAALPAAGALTKGVVNKVAPSVAMNSTKARGVIKPMGHSQAVKADPVYKQLDRRVNTAIENAGKSTGKLKENYRVEAVELIRQRNARIAEMSQGGYIQLPGGKQVDEQLFHGSKDANKVLKEGFTVPNKPGEGATFGKGVYLTPDPERAGLYTMGTGDTMGVKLAKDAKIYSPKDLTKEVFGSHTGYGDPAKISEYFKAKGYDGLRIGKGKDSEFVIFNPEKATPHTIPTQPATATPKKGLTAVTGDEVSKQAEANTLMEFINSPFSTVKDVAKAKLRLKQLSGNEDGFVQIPGKVPKDNRKVIPAAQNKPSRVPVAPKTEPAVGNTRFANKTVQGSREVSEGVKKAVKETDTSYELVHNKEQIARSEKFIKKNNIRNAVTDVKERLNAKDFDDQAVSDAIAVAKKLDAKGGKANLAESTEIYQQLSKKLTKAGQTVQAARLLNNRTPEGMKHWALKELQKEGVKLTPDKASKLEDLIGAVRQAKPDSYDAGLSRYRVAEFVARNTPTAASSKAIQIWKAGLLSSPRTTAGNLFANTMETIFKKGYVDPVSNATDALFKVFTGKRSRSMTLRGLPSGAKEGAIKGVKYFKTGYDPRNPNTKWDVRNIHFSDKPAGKVAETYTQAIFRLMGAQDQPFYYANMRNSLYDQAITAAKNSKLKGAEKTAFIKKYVTEPTKDALELADKEGRYAVFQNETALGKAASRLKGMEGPAGDVAEFVMPFSGVPSSIATRIIERTPVGTATEIVKQIRRGHFDQRAMTKAIANGSAVVPLVGTGYALAEADLITLGYPKDKTQRELWEAEGKQPYSIKVGDQWLSMNYFQPGGAIISGGAEYKNALDEGKSQSEALQIATASTGKAFTEQSFLKGVSGGLNAITDPVYAGEKFVDQTAGSVVPNFIRSGATASDEVKREARTVPDQIKRGIPGLRQTLDVKKDLFGRDVKENTSAPHALFNPLRPSRVQNADDPTTTEIRRLYDADEGLSPTQIKKDAFMKDGKGTALTDKQVDDFNAEVGKNVKTEWDKIMSNPKYKNLDDQEKNRLLQKVNDDVYGALKRKYEADNSLGQYAQDYEGKETKLSTNEKRYLEGKDIDYYAKDSSDRNPTEEYEYQKQKFEDEKDSYNEIERAQKEQEIVKLGIKKDYDEITTDLYDLNKGDAYAYVTSKGKDGEAAFMKAVEYGDKLVEAGIIDKNKWRDKYGNIDLESGSKSGKGKKGKKPWQAPTQQAVKQSGSDNRALITSVSGKIKGKRLRRKFA